MSTIAFHFNVPDRLDYACRWLRKAYRAGARVLVVAPPERLAELDVRLWAFSALDFVPHCDAGAPPAVRAASPIVLGDAQTAVPAGTLLLNLGPEVPAGVERFARIVEVVDASPPERAAARLRWRSYESAGHTIERHDQGG